MRQPDYLESDWSKEQTQIDEMLKITEREERQMDELPLVVVTVNDGVTCECGSPVVNGKCVSLDRVVDMLSALKKALG